MNVIYIISYTPYYFFLEIIVYHYLANFLFHLIVVLFINFMLGYSKPYFHSILKSFYSLSILGSLSSSVSFTFLTSFFQAFSLSSFICADLFILLKFFVALKNLSVLFQLFIQVLQFNFLQISILFLLPHGVFLSILWHLFFCPF